MTKKKCLGTGAVCTVVGKYLHPSRIYQEKYLNAAPGHVLQNLLVIRLEEKLVNRQKQVCVVFRHDDFPNKELWTVKRWAKVNSEGHKDHFFTTNTTGTPQEQNEDERGPKEITNDVRNATKENVNAMRAAGFDVDDDNDPAPENVPDTATAPTNNIYGAWNPNLGNCYRKQAGGHETRAKLLGVNEIWMQGVSFFTMFLMFFPKTFLKSVILVETNKVIDGPQVSFGEFLRFLGIWLFLSTQKGHARREYWSSKSMDPFNGPAYRFNEWMSRNRFENIITALRYTNIQPPTYKDKFCQVRQIISEWNANMKKIFEPSWVSCLDESMSIWLSKWTCPGWIFCPRKPHPFGNEYHSICCGQSSIMYAIEMVEGKDEPKELKIQYQQHGKTSGLLLRLTRSIWGRGKVVILDSGFCVLRGIVELLKKGVYSSALIKKRRYWPKYVDGAAIDTHFENIEVGGCDALPGVLDGVQFHIFGMKEPDYTMKLMSTYGSLTAKDDQRESKRIVKSETGEETTKTFQYTEPFANHYDYRHVVDDHNNNRHSGISIEETWLTHRWENRVFAFLLAISEVNAFLAFKYFIWSKTDTTTLLQFRKCLARELIFNDILVQEKVAQEKRSDQGTGGLCHMIKSAPKKARKYDGAKWILDAKKTYQQYTCITKGCKKMVRTYCSCSPGHWRCTDCFIGHVTEE